MLKLILFGGIYLVLRYVLRQGDASSNWAVKHGPFKLTDSDKQVLNEHFEYYNRLSENDKGLFERRLSFFLQNKRFFGREGFEVLHPIKVLVGAELIMMSLGLKKFFLPHFKSIYIFPEAYYNPLTKAYHKGEVNTRGNIILSWDSFAEGIANRMDGRNLALHEFAHALYIENYIKNQDYFFIEPKVLERWKLLAEQEIEYMKSGESNYIRAYGSTNTDEFFAVTSELFFEQPVQFKKEHPELFDIMVSVFKQDPIGPTFLS